METSDHQWPWPHLYLSCPPKTEGEKDRCKESHRVQVRWKLGMGIWETKVRRVKRAKRIETKTEKHQQYVQIITRLINLCNILIFWPFLLQTQRMLQTLHRNVNARMNSPCRSPPFTHTHLCKSPDIRRCNPTASWPEVVIHTVSDIQVSTGLLIF